VSLRGTKSFDTWNTLDGASNFDRKKKDTYQTSADPESIMLQVLGF
jgi:hypothetical protein